MFNVLLLVTVISLLLICIMIFKDIICPPVIMCIAWTIPIAVITITEMFKNNSYEFNKYAFVFVLGIILFVLGYVAINRKTIRNNFRLNLNKKLIPKKGLIILIIIEIVVFIIFFIGVYKYVMSHYKYNFWFSYKYATELGYYKEFLITPFFRALSRFLVCLLFINYLNDNNKYNRNLFFIQLVITFLYSALGQGRGGMFSFLIPLFIIYVMMKRKSIIQIAKNLGIMFVILMIVFVGYSKVKNPYEDQDIEYYLKKFENYTSGSLVAFCNWADNDNKEMAYGKYTFRFFYAVLNSLGFDVEVKSMVEPYVENLNGNVGNVYTIYKWYANDFGLVYAILMQFLVGILHGILYRNSYEKNDYFWIVINALFYYPLVMQFFMDEYVTLLSLWIQYAIIGVFLIRFNFIFNIVECEKN